MAIKTLLAPVSAADVSRSTLDVALKIARRVGAHIDVLHVRPDPRGLVPYTGEGMDGSMIEEIMDVTEREGGERAAQTKEMFDAFAAENSVSVTDEPASGDEVTISWHSDIGREDEIVAIRGRLYDLIVVGRPLKDAALPSPITLEAALLDTGRPIVVAPPTAPAALGRSIAIAWEGSPEAARAIADAMPFLEQAETITILAPANGQVAPLEPEELVRQLAWHGVSSRVQPFDASITELGAAFLEQSATAGADTLVKGAYSQSRLRQLILGGRTRHILANTTIPVLLAH